ncbi:hypothetical protein [Serratia ureilytica]|uniref:hypothetical protein n=1 Tax=Serratia ureilytica TaxID=300181 RepID=UPI00191CB171|nr:hypothetical protein [Serratia ureilytica]MBL0880390.1 hypothetical protein [Serratia ureilytica]MDN2472648.1 hypothetical protein [Serratia ureilytica]
MTDIYHALLTYDFSQLKDESLIEYRNIYGDAGMAINSAIRLIGNLLLEVECNEDYSEKDAKRDLLLVGSVLRHLPRIAQALDQNVRHAECEIKKREGAAK